MAASALENTPASRAVPEEPWPLPAEPAAGPGLARCVQAAASTRSAARTSQSENLPFTTPRPLARRDDSRPTPVLEVALRCELRRDLDEELGLELGEVRDRA